MRVLMLATRRGVEDPYGDPVRQFHEGERYEITDGLARQFIRERVAVHVEGDEEVDTSSFPKPVNCPFAFRFPD